jgi:hypothetical protein
MTDIASFLTPLARFAARYPDLEGAVVWGDAGGWEAQDDTTELLDAEEVAFYAEGLLLEGFSMIWQAMAAADSPKQPDHILLMFWQGAEPPATQPSEGWLILAHDKWTAQS